jgi:hypothetical protein
LINLNLGPITLSFIGAGSKKDLATIQRLKATHGDQWPFHWLDLRGVEYRHLLRPSPATEEAAPLPESEPNLSLQS